MAKNINFKETLFDQAQSVSALTNLDKTVDYMLSLQRPDGYWWFTLEANESIGAEFIFLMHYLGDVDKDIERGIANRIMDVERPDGTWALYNEGPPDLSSTIECYFALKIASVDINADHMKKARVFILKNGGIEKARVFTKIHLAMFGLVPWDSAAAMPAEYILMPHWAGCSIYEFSSWARATIVPLLIFMSKRHTVKLDTGTNLDELFVNPVERRDYRFKTQKGLFSPESFFILLDKLFKVYEKVPFKPLRKISLDKCAKWIWEHVEKTEDIYPALAYCALAFKALGYSNDAPQIKKPFEALKMFQQRYTTLDVPALPDEVRDDGTTAPSKLRLFQSDDARRITHNPSTLLGASTLRIHQQCCISPVWDTPWMIMALINAGVSPDHPALVKAGRWLIKKQITQTKGDWAIKNPKAAPGGFSFEFENDFFPDVDDTIEVLTAVHHLNIPRAEKDRATKLGFDWLMSMQNSDGGWGAFDKDQTLTLVNRIPFSDHSACLDPSSPDIVGRMLEFLALKGFSKDYFHVSKAIDYIWRTQEKFGGWFARWGINYIYGTWCVLTGLKAIGWDMKDSRVLKAVSWLKEMQHADGGFGESPASYEQKTYVPYGTSVPSQTAWGLMAFVAAGEAQSDTARRAANYLLNNRNANCAWDEMHYTGTGFPGHFYIRYHGYRHFFPLLALGRFFAAT